MKRILFLGLILLMTLPARAQNFQAIQDNGYKLFDMGYSLRGIKVDSTDYIGGDSIFYLSKSIQVEDDYECYDVQAPSWMGDHVRVSPDGAHVFFNMDGDSIHLQTMAELGETWIVFNGNDLIILGEIISIEIDTIFDDLTDLIKTMSLQAYDAQMNPISHYVNELVVKFSENYGLVQTINFIAFPEGEDVLVGGLVLCSLVGIEGIESGIQNLTYREVFDFQPGDELHVKTRNTSMSGGTEVRSIFRYLERVDQEEMTIYTVQIESDTFNLAPFQMIHSGFSSEIVELNIGANPSFDQYAMTPIFSTWSENDTVVYFLEQRSFGPRKKVQYFGNYLHSNWPGCYSYLIDGGCQTGGQMDYIEKRGGPYYYCQYGISFMTTTSRELVYYNINSVEWGTPFSLWLSANEADENNFSLYPNPATDHIYVENTGNVVLANIQISDLQGRVLKSVRTRQERTEIDINELPAGIFIYSIVSDEKILKTGKFIVQR